MRSPGYDRCSVAHSRRVFKPVNSLTTHHMLPEISCWAFSFSPVSSAFRGLGIGDLQNRLFLPYAAVVLLFLMHSSHDRPPLRVSCLPSLPTRCTRNDFLTSSLLSSVMPCVCASPWTLLLHASFSFDRSRSWSASVARRGCTKYAACTTIASPMAFSGAHHAFLRSRTGAHRGEGRCVSVV